jgi:hypothetical protein
VSSFLIIFRQKFSLYSYLSLRTKCDTHHFLPHIISLITLDEKFAWVTPWSMTLLGKLTVPQLVENFLAFYETRNLVTVFKNPILSQINSVHILTPSFYNIQFNIILPSTPRTPTWPLLTAQFVLHVLPTSYSSVLSSTRQNILYCLIFWIILSNFTLRRSV